MRPPQIIILAGSNGAGKSTIAAGSIVAGLPFLNADEIEIELSVGHLSAGRTLIYRLNELVVLRSDFVIETTLAGKWLSPRLTALRDMGYRVHIIFVWVASEELAIERVAARVRVGGHNIPEAAICRRYRRGVRNFWRIYEPLAHTWEIYDNSTTAHRLVAAKGSSSEVVVHEPEVLRVIKELIQND